MPEAILRVTLTRGPGERGYTPKAEGRPTVVMTLHAAPASENPIQWSLVTSSFRVLAADPLSSFKTLNKLTHVMARAEAAEKGADEALLINTNGEVAETASGNIFWVYNDKICTTPTGRGVLPGITRAVVLEICQALGLLTNKRVIKPEALRNSEGIFITQSAFGIVPVAIFRRRTGRPIAAGGSNFQRVPRTACQSLGLPCRAGPPLCALDWKRCAGLTIVGDLIIYISHHQIARMPLKSAVLEE